MTSDRTRRLMVRAAPLAWMVLIFGLSSIPGSDLPSGPDYASTLVHVVLYFVLGVLTRLTWMRDARSSSVARATGLASAYGITDELHQVFVAGRAADPIDWAVDTASALVGALIADRMVRRRSE